MAPCHPPPVAPEARRSPHNVPRTQWRFGSWTSVRHRLGEGGGEEEEAVPWHDCGEGPTAISHCESVLFFSNTQCSATCGKGTRMRYVSCRDEDGSVADEGACANLPRPVAKEECSVTPCGQWKASDWSAVSQKILWNWGSVWGAVCAMKSWGSHVSMSSISELNSVCDLNYSAPHMCNWSSVQGILVKDARNARFLISGVIN